MKIYIPSYKRALSIGAGTLAAIPSEYMPDVHIVVRNEEVDVYRRVLESYQEVGLKVIGVDATGIADKRKMIGYHADAQGYDRFLTTDDDVKFSVRISEDTTDLRQQTEDDTREMIATMSELLNDYAHVAVSLRGGNQHVGPGPSPLVAECGRGIRVVAYRTKEFLSVEHGRVSVMEDMDVTLQLLRAGYKNAILFWWAQDQKQTNAPGGCSTWRTHEVHEAAARELVRLHAPYVSLREKNNKTGGAFGTRTEVTCHWKKSWQSSCG